MKVVTIGYVVSLLFGYSLGHNTSTQVKNDPTPSSTQLRSIRSSYQRPMESLGGRTEAAESLKVKFTTLGAEKSLAVLNKVIESGQRPELEQWAANAPEAREALEVLRKMPDLADYKDWLGSQLEDMEVADDSGPELASVVFNVPPPPKLIRAKAQMEYIPLYEKWLQRISNRPHPRRASEFLPVVRAAFAAEGLPEALVWLAETESTFNPHARNPVGSCGLFQLMPETARSLGLSLQPYDQRLNPSTSARAAARYLTDVPLFRRVGLR